MDTFHVIKLLVDLFHLLFGHNTYCLVNVAFWTLSRMHSLLLKSFQNHKWFFSFFTAPYFSVCVATSASHADLRPLLQPLSGRFVHVLLLLSIRKWMFATPQLKAIGVFSWWKSIGPYVRWALTCVLTVSVWCDTIFCQALLSLHTQWLPSFAETESEILETLQKNLRIVRNVTNLWCDFAEHGSLGQSLVAIYYSSPFLLLVSCNDSVAVFGLVFCLRFCSNAYYFDARLSVRSHLQIRHTTKGVWVAVHWERRDLCGGRSFSQAKVYLNGCASDRSRGRMEGKRKQNSSRAGWKSSIYSTLTAHSPQLFCSRPARLCHPALVTATTVLSWTRVRSLERFLNFSTCDFAHLCYQMGGFVWFFPPCKDDAVVFVNFFPPLTHLSKSEIKPKWNDFQRKRRNYFATVETD